MAGSVAADQKKAGQEGWSIVGIDETGFLLQPLVRRTWAPRGQTPVHYSWDRHDRLSALSALTLAPVRRRLGRYFQLHEHHIRFAEVMAFLRLVHRHLRRKILLILDRAGPHRKAVRLLREAGVDGLEVEWLPAYAPDLNPVELIWNHTKYVDLANYLPDDIHDLHRAVTSSIQAARANGRLLRSAFEQAGLNL